MEARVRVSVEIDIPITYGEEVFESFVEKLARDVVVDTLHSAGKRMSIVGITALSEKITKG